MGQAKASFFMSDGELVFKMSAPSIADRNAAPFEFEGRATEKHKQDYPAAWKAFEESQKTSKGKPVLKASAPKEPKEPEDKKGN